MDIYSYIVRDHRKVAGLMDDLLSIRLPAVRASLFEQVRTELAIHNAAEERTFYVALANAAQDANTVDKVQHSAREHHEVNDLLDTLHDTPISSEFWLEKFGELKHAVTHHVEEEEGEVFAKARQLLTSAQATQLAIDMDELKIRIHHDFELDIPVA